MEVGISISFFLNGGVKPRRMEVFDRTFSTFVRSVILFRVYNKLQVRLVGISVAFRLVVFH